MRSDKQSYIQMRIARETQDFLVTFIHFKTKETKRSSLLLSENTHPVPASKQYATLFRRNRRTPTKSSIHQSTILTAPSLPTRYNPSHSLTSSSLFPPLVTLRTPLTSLAAPVPSSRTLNTLRAECACCTVKAADSLSIGVGAVLASACVAERNGPSAGVVRRVLWTAGWERRVRMRVDRAVEFKDDVVARSREG